jgi:hypothetical protein
MIELLARYWPSIWATISPVLFYMLATGAANLLTYLATDSAWLSRHPRWAGVFKMLRGIGFSPSAVAQGVQIIAGSRLPNSLQPLVGRTPPPSDVEPQP